MGVFQIYGIFIFISVVEIWTRLSQIEFLKRTKDDTPILMSAESFATARNYALDKQKYEIFKMVATIVITGFWLMTGIATLINYLGDTSLISQTVAVVAFIAINYVLYLPLEAYGIFVLDKAYGFSNMTPKLYIQDFLKSAAIFLLIGTPIIYAALWIIASLQNWWLWCFVFLFALVLLANWLVPVFFLPLFNKFLPLENDALESSIKELAVKSDFQISGVFKIDASKRDNRLNAYFTGIGNTKRVALFDTLLTKLEQSEILAVLAHEFGHYKHKHLISNLAITGVSIFLLCAIFGILRIQGFGDAPSIIVLQFLLLGGSVSFIVLPFVNFLSKKNEFEADNYAKNMGLGSALCSALTKLVEENKSYPKASAVYKFFHYTHPSVLERIEKLES